MKRFATTVLMTAVLMSIGSAFAATPAELYDDVWKIVNKKYYDPTNNSQDWSKWRYRYENKLKTKEDAYVAIETMLTSLNDPYTRFLDPKEFSEETQSIKGSLKGIGTQIGLRDGELVIIAPLEDSPAEKAGLLADDRILEINGESTKGISIDAAADKIRGEKKSKVQTEIDNTRKALEENDTAKIKEATEKLTKVFYDMSEQLYKNANPNGAQGAAGADPNAQAGTENNGNAQGNDGNVYDADYKVEDDNNNK